MKTIRFFLLISFVLLQMTVQAQKIHVIVFCDTNDEKIGVNKESERKLTINEMQTIAGYLESYGYDSEFTECYGNNCNKQNLMQVINGLQVEANDVVFFYYGGHGSHAAYNETDPFPQMCLGEDYETNWVPVTLIKNIITKKNPRLSVILTGCCNKEDSGVSIKSLVAESGDYTYETQVNKEAYKKLFLESTGIVMMTSSKLGQYSYSGKEGGIFCLSFWDTMKLVGANKVEADWKAICESVKQYVSKTPIRAEEGIVYQEPYYEIQPFRSIRPILNTNRITHRITTVNNNISSLYNDINQLLNKSVSIDNRMIMVDDVLSKHFTHDAKVLTIGRDMSTVVDYEDAETFLRRIIMSPFILQINIIEENGGLNSLIRVHEVRTK